MLKKYPVLSSAISSLLLLCYICLVAALLENGEKIFGKVESMSAPIIMLLLLVFSAFISGLLLLGGPVYLYFEKMKKEAIKMLLANGLFLVTILLAALLYQIIF